MLAFYVMMVDTSEDKALIEKLYALYERTMYGVAHISSETGMTLRMLFMRLFSV